MEQKPAFLRLFLKSMGLNSVVAGGAKGLIFWKGLIFRHDLLIEIFLPPDWLWRSSRSPQVLGWGWFTAACKGLGYSPLICSCPEAAGCVMCLKHVVNWYLWVSPAAWQVSFCWPTLTQQNWEGRGGHSFQFRIVYGYMGNSLVIEIYVMLFFPGNFHRMALFDDNHFVSKVSLWLTLPVVCSAHGTQIQAHMYSLFHTHPIQGPGCSNLETSPCTPARPWWGFWSSRGHGWTWCHTGSSPPGWLRHTFCAGNPQSTGSPWAPSSMSGLHRTRWHRGTYIPGSWRTLLPVNIRSAKGLRWGSKRWEKGDKKGRWRGWGGNKKERWRGWRGNKKGKLRGWDGKKKEKWRGWDGNKSEGSEKRTRRGFQQAVK